VLSPISMGVFSVFTVILHWSPVLALIPMTIITTPISYKIHRMQSFTGNELRWHVHMRRWAVLRLVAFLVGMGIVALLSPLLSTLAPITVAHYMAAGMNGAAQAPFGYLATERWAMAVL
jgi:putative flippase GtrA